MVSDSPSIPSLEDDFRSKENSVLVSGFDSSSASIESDNFSAEEMRSRNFCKSTGLDTKSKAPAFKDLIAVSVLP